MWGHAEDGAFLSIDFAKAYDSVSHTFFEATMRCFTMQAGLVSILVRSFAGVVWLCVVAGVVAVVKMEPRSGIKPGVPC